MEIVKRIRRQPFGNCRFRRNGKKKGVHIEQSRRGQMWYRGNKQSIPGKLVNKPTKPKKTYIRWNKSSYSRPEYKQHKFVPIRARHNNSPYKTYKTKYKPESLGEFVNGKGDYDSDATTTTGYWS